MMFDVIIMFIACMGLKVSTCMCYMKLEENKALNLFQ